MSCYCVHSFDFRAGNIARALQRECSFSAQNRTNEHSSKTCFALITHLLSIQTTKSWKILINNQFKSQSLNRKSYRKLTLSYFSVTCFKHVELLWPISALDRKQVRGYAINRIYDTLIPWQSRRHHANRILSVLLKIVPEFWNLLKSVHVGAIENNSALVQATSEHRTGDKPLPDLITINFNEPRWCNGYINDRAKIPDSKALGANMGPNWPHVGSMNFAIWDG